MGDFLRFCRRFLGVFVRDFWGVFVGFFGGCVGDFGGFVGDLGGGCSYFGGCQSRLVPASHQASLVLSCPREDRDLFLWEYTWSSCD